MVDVASHARHDRFAIAAALGGGAVPSTVRTCPSCGALHRDLLSIQVAIRHAWTPRLPRDLRLRRGDTAAGHQTAWQRLLGAFGSARDHITRPLSIGLMSLGIAGLVLANLTVGFGASPTIALNTTNDAIPICSMSRRPRSSPSRPPMIGTIPNASAYPEIGRAHV